MAHHTNEYLSQLNRSYLLYLYKSNAETERRGDSEENKEQLHFQTLYDHVAQTQPDMFD